MVIHAVFVDRDGTIGGSDKVEYPGEFALFPSVEASLEKLKQAGVKLFSFTNQPGISKGEAAREDFIRELEGFGFDEVCLCPHHPDEGCRCRKPGTGMLMQAREDYQLDLAKCVVIGDRWTDMVAADIAGCISILVKTGAGAEAYKKFQNNTYTGRWAEVDPELVANNFEQAVDWIFERYF
ncbi:HAD-IIIA family hydrolase [Virgibacillus kekensis]|uniref:D,D-heptose 1,7-bisphosphate phosphatase n=1 Tax=Virgibacillus kekensis TaxID=202261 RepID=A0ABV9DMN3_9BACI